MQFDFRAVRNTKGFSLLEILTVTAIIGILAVIAIPQYNAYKERSYDADAKSNLHNFYIACKAYWQDTVSSNPCSLAIAQNASYGYNQSLNVTVAISGGADTETTFQATANHGFSAKTFTVNSAGNITP